MEPINPEKLPNVIRNVDLKKIANVIIEPRYMIIFVIAFFCGLRASEISKLRKKDVDLEHGVLKVVQGKRHKDRYVTIPDLIFNILRLWLEYIKDIESEYFIPSIVGTPLSPCRLNKRFKQFCDKAGILKVEYIDKSGAKRCNYHLHSLRHSYASYRLEKGDNEINIMNELGHVDLRMTKIYAKTAVKARKEATDKIFPNKDRLRELIEKDDKELMKETMKALLLELKKKQSKEIIEMEVSE